MAANLTVETCGEVFAPTSRQASSNYGIGSDGRVACYLPEEYHPWTSSSWWNDDRAITIEVANTTEGCWDGTWAVSDAAWNSLIDLCADICTRYGFELVFTGDQYGSLTRHNFYAPTNCPGQYIEARTYELCEAVNAKVRGDDMTPEQMNQLADMVTARVWEYCYHMGMPDQDKVLNTGEVSNRYNVLNNAYIQAREAATKIAQLEERIKKLEK